MHLSEVYEELTKIHTDELIVGSAGAAGGEWFRQADGPEVFYLQASIGTSSMFALGVARAAPQRKVWVFEGDGSLSMNPGSLMTIADTAPDNLVHFVLVNGVYGSTGRLPLTAATKLDTEALARAAGIERTITVDAVQDLRDQVIPMLAEPGPTFVALRIANEDMPKVEVGLDGHELKYRFMRYMEDEVLGEKILNERGY